VVPWFVYSLRTLQIYWRQFALLFLGWFLLSEAFTAFPVIGFWAKAAAATFTAQGLAWAFHLAAGGRPPAFNILMKAITLPPAIQVFIIAQVLLALALGIGYLGWVEGEPAIRFFAMRDLSIGNPVQPHHLIVFKLIIGLATLWFSYVGLVGFCGVGELPQALAMSVRGALLNLPALLLLTLAEIVADVLAEALPETVVGILAGLVLELCLIAILVGASYASFRDIFRPEDVVEEEPTL
jgi:hypothetical protein